MQIQPNVPRDWLGASGALLRGVRYTAGGAVTDSIVMRSRSGTVRRIEAQHRWGKLEQLAAV